MAFDTGDNWDSQRTPPQPDEFEQQLIKEAKKRYKDCEDWEAQARILFDYDYKFANGDSHNKYQWDADLVNARELEDRPVLTINKTQVHNLLVINDAKQNKPGVRIRPVGDEASYEGAQIFQELVYHIEYISSAENVYDYGTTFQVEAGIGYWRVQTDYISNDVKKDGERVFDQEIYIRKIKDPKSVYLDPNINEDDGSDARYGFIFEDMPKDLFCEKYPDFAAIAGSATLNNASGDGWITRDNVRVCEYFRKEQKKEIVVSFFDQASGTQVTANKSELSPEGKTLVAELKKARDPSYQERKLLTDNIQWYKIAGDRIIESGPWLGKYIPIVRLPGTETVIDGIMDRKGHTRALINAQQIYNYNTSANVEYGALQTKSPWIAPSEAIEGFEEYYKTANTINHSYLPYNHIGEDGGPIPAPARPNAPQASPAYVEQMKIAQNEMMMVTGQYQSQFGENENAKSGVAINARQRQGDKVTYHFIDNQAKAIRFTGKILIDLIPKIYDTKRIKQIMATDGSILDVTIDPEAEQGYQKLPLGPEGPKLVDGKQVEQIIFNPNFGIYDIQADTGPSYATKRMEAVAALTQVAAADKNFMGIAGDVYFKMLDFPDADVLAKRYYQMIPPNIKGEGLPPEIEQTMHQASDKIEQLTALASKQAQELENKDRELRVKEQEFELKMKVAEAEQARLDYDAENKRLAALGNSGPAVSVEQIQPIVRQLLQGMLNAGEPGNEHVIPHKTVADIAAENTALEPPEAAGEGTQPQAPVEEEPPVKGAKKAPDGHWYVGNAKEGFQRVEI